MLRELQHRAQLGLAIIVQSNVVGASGETINGQASVTYVRVWARASKQTVIQLPVELDFPVDQQKKEDGGEK